MVKRSAGLLPFRTRNGQLEVLLGHPGGPYWSRRDAGAWSIIKGEYSATEAAETAARREFLEETGWAAEGEVLPLGEVRQPGGKWVTAFAHDGDFATGTLRSNSFEIEWPPRSGKKSTYPEIDRAEWFDLATASTKILTGQKVFLERLEALVAEFPGNPTDHRRRS